MSDVIWKRFSLDELFEFNSGNQLPYTRKELDVSEIKDETYNIAVVAQSERNNGVTCYVDGNTIDKAKIMKNYMIYSLNFGTCFYQQNDFVLLDTHGSIFRLVAKDNGLEEILRNDYIIGNFFSKSIMKICKNGVYNYNWKPNAQRASSEVILLPCLEVSSQEESIWEEDGKFYTLAVDYIKQLMEEAKELKEQKTIRLYEAERAKYEAERAKYEAVYNEEKKSVIWKRFNLKKTFERNTPPSTDSTAKELNIYDTSFENSIALITRAETNNGVRGFIEKGNFSILKKGITYNDQFSFFLFHDYEFTTIKDHLSVITAKNEKFQEILDANSFVDMFITTLLNRVFSKQIFSFNYTGADYRYDREIILLPCLEVSSQEKSIWEEDGKFYTLAVNYISYLYLSGKVNQNQKLIDNYTYQY